MTKASRSEMSDAPGRACLRLRQAAFILLLSVTAARCFLGEVPFRTTISPVVTATTSGPVDVDRRELGAMTFSALILIAVALWALAGAGEGRLQVHHPFLALGVGAFAVLSLVSVFGAADRCAAWDGWVMQTSLLCAMLLAAELCRTRAQQAMLLTVLAAVAVAMAARGAWHIYETPYRIESFETHRAELLEEFGWAEGSAEAGSLSARARSYSPVGYVGLANVFASSLILLTGAAAAVAVARFSAVRLGWDQWRRVRKPGEINTPAVAAALAVPGAVAAATILALTGSRGAIAASLVAIAVAVVLHRWSEWFFSHRRGVLAAVGAVFALSVAGVIAWGLSHDSLPTKTMTFRWFYWTAGIRALREHLFFGVGGGNFPAAYLLHRVAAAEEAVKTPHSVIVHALVQYGLVGGACYLGVLGGLLVNLTRRGTQAPTTGGRASFGELFTAGVVVVLAVFLTRALLGGAAGEMDLLVLDAFGAVAVTGSALVVCFWRIDAVTVGRAARIIVGCALGAFVLHNMVTLGFWSGGPAMVFWVLGGGMLATTDGNRRTIRRLRWPVAGVAVAVLATVICVRWVAVYNKTRLTEVSATAAVRGRWDDACRLAEQAAAADRIDSQPQERLAMLYLQRPSETWSQREDHLRKAYMHARVASAMNALSVTHARRAQEAAEGLARLGARGDWEQEAYRWLARAVELDPNNSQLRLQFAQFLANAGNWKECLAQLDRARKIQASLLSGSGYAFSEAKWEQVRRLERIADKGRNAGGERTGLR